MTKIGEGKSYPEEPSIQQYHHQFDTNAIKFLKALDGYKEAANEEKTHFIAAMDQSLGLIHSAVKELNYPGMAKQEKLVESDYKKYLQDQSEHNLTKLESDFTTLRDYNRPLA